MDPKTHSKDKKKKKKRHLTSSLQGALANQRRDHVPPSGISGSTMSSKALRHCVARPHASAQAVRPTRSLGSSARLRCHCAQAASALQQAFRAIESSTLGL